MFIHSSILMSLFAAVVLDGRSVSFSFLTAHGHSGLRKIPWDLQGAPIASVAVLIFVKNHSTREGVFLKHTP
ncbi:hypothetical protein EDD85DRAFT_826671 [Armillaria nabsnona]|nr:hypothetical protein EDD85DRAFT_826671 [Armillaria nabsnona]